MLNWALMFFVVALAAAALGVHDVAGSSARIGWLFAVIGTILLVVALVTRDGRRRGPPIL
jgi:uncharacterized membrane protein YtjA (UPF0391 family)